MSIPTIMRCQVYCEAKGQLLLVPDSREARSEVERSFGPLKHCGSIDTQDLPAQLVPKIESELSAHCYAVLSFGVIEGIASGRRDLTFSAARRADRDPHRAARDHHVLGAVADLDGPHHMRELTRPLSAPNNALMGVDGRH